MFPCALRAQHAAPLQRPGAPFMRCLLVRCFTVSVFALASTTCMGQAPVQSDDDPPRGAVEAARKTRDEAKLHSLQEQLEQKIAGDSKDAGSYLDLAKVNAYLLDVYEMRREKKSAVAAVDRAIDLTLHSIQLNDKSAEAHSLLADLYGRKISLGNGMFAGPKFGPKVKEENAKAMAPGHGCTTGRNLGLARQSFPEARGESQSPRRHAARPLLEFRLPVGEILRLVTREIEPSLAKQVDHESVARFIYRYEY